MFAGLESHMKCFTVESATSGGELPDGSVYQPHCTYAVGKHNQNGDIFKGVRVCVQVCVRFLLIY